MRLLPFLAGLAVTLLQSASPALAAAPFPIAQSSYGPLQESLINNEQQSFLAAYTGADFTRARQALATATGAAADLVHEYEGNPNLLAAEYYSATATPTWFAALPTGLRSYVVTLAGLEASIASRDALSTQVEVSTSSAGGDGDAPSSSTSTAGAVDGQARLGAVGAAVVAGLAGVAWL